MDKRTREILCDIVHEISVTVGEGFFSVLMGHLVSHFRARGAFVAKTAPGSPGRYEIMVSAGRAPLPGEGSFQLSVAQQALLRDHPLCPPECRLFETLAETVNDPEVSSLLAIPLTSSDATPLGMAVVLWEKTGGDGPGATTILLSLKERLCAELERENSTAAVLEQVHFLQELIDAIPTPIFFKDNGLRYIGGNREFMNALGMTREEFIGKTVHDIAPMDFVENYHATDLALLNGEKVDAYQGSMRYADGKRREVIFTKSLFRTPAKEVGGIVGTMFDITSTKILEERAHRLANFDPLTELPNRTRFLKNLEQVLSLTDRVQHPVAVLCLDLDKFKVVNDSLGFEACNTMLKIYAERLAAQGRGRDFLARTGGDRFAIALYPIAHEEDAAMVARRILQVIGEPVLLEGQEVHGTASIGIALYPRDGRSAEALLDCADSAMYQAKTRSKSGYQYYSREVNAATQEQFALEAAMRRGLEHGEFALHYQPLIDLPSGVVVGAEALLRWHRKDGTTVPPSEFIPIAEESGLIHPLGEWALREACRQNRAWQAEGFPRIMVAVNISGHQLNREGFVPMVQGILADTGLPAESLELELTESSLMENSEANVQRLHDLKALGIKLSIDDFGTGYSSLSYLKRFPLDVLKIDRSFITDLSREGHDRAIIEAIIAMAHRLGLKVLAEGIETSAQLEFLQKQRCCKGQGYFFSRALPAVDFEGFLTRRGSLCPLRIPPDISPQFASA